MIIEDRLVDKTKAIYRTTPVPETAVYKEREAWLTQTLITLPSVRIDEINALGVPTGRKLKVKSVRVDRGRYDDVIGIQTQYELA